jgi:hypothetical membrane protein
MHAWEFAKALHLQREHGWVRFVSMQDHYNLLAREEEREMIPLCLDEGVGTIVWSPLARGRLARPWDQAKATARSDNDGFADMLYTPQTAQSDRAIIDAVGQVAEARGAKRAQVALAWLRSKPVVTAPIVGASSTAQIDDAVAALDIELHEEEIRALEAPYTPRYDFQGVSDDAELLEIMKRLPQFTTLGTILLLAGPVTSWIAEFITAAAWQHPPYAPLYNWVSLLGVPGPSQIAFKQVANSPLAWVMNTGWIFYGVVLIISAAPLLDLRAGARPVGLLALAVISGIGVCLVGIFHGSEQNLENGLIAFHTLGAQAVIIVGNVFVLLTGSF